MRSTLRAGCTAALALAGALAGCKGKPHPQPAPGSAAPGSAAAAPAIAVKHGPAVPFFKIGAPGGSVHAFDLVARDDGGFILEVNVIGALTIGGTAVKSSLGTAGFHEPVSTVIALDATGKVRWVRPLDGHCTELRVAVHGTQTFVAGSCSHPIATRNGRLAPPEVDDHLHVFVAMLDDTGAIAWAKYIGRRGQQLVSDVALDPSGNEFVVGRFTAPIDFGTGLLTPPPTPDGAGYVAAFDPAGKPRWVKTFPGDDLQAVVATADEVDIAGIFAKRTQLGTIALTAERGGRFVARLGNADGAPNAAVVVGKNASLHQQLVRAPSGTLYLAADTLEGIGLFAIDPKQQATELHVIPVRDASLIECRALALDPEGRLLLSTSFGKPVDFGGGTLEPSGTGDAILVAYAPSGKFVAQTLLATPAEDTSGGVAIDHDGTPVVAWFAESGPPGKPYEEWLATEDYYATMVQRVAL